MLTLGDQHQEILQLDIFQNPLNCPLIQFGSGSDPQFLLDVGAVGLNGVDTQKEFFCDATRRFCLTNHAKDFQFPIRELLNGICSDLQMLPDRSLKKTFRHAGAQVNLPGKDASNRCQQHVRRF